jgi:hypothetical protein
MVHCDRLKYRIADKFDLKKLQITQHNKLSHFPMTCTNEVLN